MTNVASMVFEVGPVITSGSGTPPGQVCPPSWTAYQITSTSSGPPE
jgi:hypothetical protein